MARMRCVDDASASASLPFQLQGNGEEDDRLAFVAAPAARHPKERIYKANVLRSGPGVLFSIPGGLQVTDLL